MPGPCCLPTLQAVDDVVSGKAYNALVGCRPPGHHAGRCGEPNLGGALQGRRSSSRCSSGSEVGQGFCVLNTVAIAAKHARARWGLMRATVIDIDMHHVSIRRLHPILGDGRALITPFPPVPVLSVPCSA